MEIAAWILGVVLLVLFLALATVVVTGVPIALAFFAAAATLKRLRQVPEAELKTKKGPA